MSISFCNIRSSSLVRFDFILSSSNPNCVWELISEQLLVFSILFTVVDVQTWPLGMKWIFSWIYYAWLFSSFCHFAKLFFCLVIVRPTHDRRTTVVQPTHVRPLHDRHTTDTRPTHDRRTTDARRLHECRMTVARPTHDCRTTDARPSHDRRTTVARPTHDRCTNVAWPSHDRRTTDNQPSTNGIVTGTCVAPSITASRKQHIQYMHTIDALSTHHRHAIGILSTRHCSSNDDRRSTNSIDSDWRTVNALSTQHRRITDTLYYQTNESKIKFINPHIRFFLVSGISFRLKIRQIEINNQFSHAVLRMKTSMLLSVYRYSLGRWGLLDLADWDRRKGCCEEEGNKEKPSWIGPFQPTMSPLFYTLSHC